jgi:hypothetical protein
MLVKEAHVDCNILAVQFGGFVLFNELKIAIICIVRLYHLCYSIAQS